jgi:hypothetical protein
MQALAVRRAQQTRLQMKERNSRRNCLRARVPAPRPIHSYCKEPSAKASQEMARADSAKTDWFRAILLVKTDPADSAPAEDAAGLVAADREEDKAALADPAGEGVVLAELPAECSEAEEVVAPGAAGAED